MHLEILRLQRYDASNLWVDYVKPVNNEEGAQMKQFFKYLIVWVSQNLSIPFWMVGHVHLSMNVYEDIYEIIASFSMNLIVAAGFIIDYIDTRK